MRNTVPTIAAAIALALASPAHAGQVRVNVQASPNLFVPATVQINQGDHVVWVWTIGAHSVTSGDPDTPDGLFDSGTFGTFAAPGTAFSWKATVTGNRPYYCQPHSNEMTGVLQISASGVAVSDFRITEVEFGATGGRDRIEIANLGNAEGNLGRYRVDVNGTSQSPGDIVPLADVIVPPGGRVTVFTNQAGTNSQTQLYMTGINDLPVSGSVALYAPFRLSTVTPGPYNASLMIDFVQWGASGQPNEGIAAAAGLWPTGQFVAGEPTTGYSISFCGTTVDHGPTYWNVTTANFGSSGICSTPTLNTSWGRLKQIYR